MDVRCTQCGTLTPIDGGSERVESLVDCQRCGHGYSIDDLQKLAPRFHAREQGYATSNQPNTQLRRSNNWALWAMLWRACSLLTTQRATSTSWKTAYVGT